MTEHDWSKKYSAALLERNRSLSMIRIDEAHKAILKRAQEIPETCNKRQKFMKKPTHSRYDRFGLFELNLQTGELWKQGVTTRLGQQAFKVLALLLQHPGQVRTREELRCQLWPAGIFVDFDHSLNKAIYDLRAALGDSAINPCYIETVVGHGYRFISIPQAPRGRAVRPRNARIDSLAVLPFANHPSDSETEFINERITERIIDTITRTSGVRVLAYSTVQSTGKKTSIRGPWDETCLCALSPQGKWLGAMTRCSCTWN